MAATWGGRALLGVDAFPGYSDILTYYYPLYEFFYQNLAAGKLILWNPYQACGIPTIATLQGGFFYPPHLLYLLLPTHAALAVLNSLHLVWIGLSTFLLARALPLRTPAATGAGISCALGVIFHNEQMTPNLLEASAWLPLGALASLQLARGPQWPWGAVLAISTAASALAGYPQATVYCAYAWGWVFIAQLVSSRRRAREWIRALIWFTTSAALGAFIAAVQLLPAAELSSEGIRGLGAISLEHMFPYGWPGLRGLNRVTQLVGPVGSALVVVSLTNRRLRGEMATFAILAVTTFLVTLGPATPIFAAYERLPLLGAFRIPTRILFVTGFALSLLVGIGIETASGMGRKAAPRQGVKRVHQKLVRLVLAAALITWATLAVRLDLGGEGLRGVASLLVLVCTLLVVARAACRGQAIVSALAVVLTLAVVADVLLAPFLRLKLPYTSSGYIRRYHQQAPIMKRLIDAPDRVWILDHGGTPDLPANLASVFRIRSIDAYEPFSLNRQREYLTYLVTGRLPAREEFPRPRRVGRPRRRIPAAFSGRLSSLVKNTNLMDLGSRARLLDLMAMRYFLAPGPAIRNPSVRSSLRYLDLLPAGTDPNLGSSIELFENPRSLPRAFVTYNAAPAPRKKRLLDLMSRKKFDPLQRSFVEERGEGPGMESDLRGHPARIVRDEEHVVEIAAAARADGLLVLADTFYPGWTAAVDGKPARIERVNYLFRGVSLTKGTHHVRFEFKPGSFRLGAGISLLALILLGGSVCAMARKRGAGQSRPRSGDAGAAGPRWTSG